MSSRDHHVHPAARELVYELIVKLQRDGDLRGVLTLENYLRDHELALRRKLSAAYDAGRANKYDYSPDAA